jgi:hypothetical protein
MSDEGTSDDDGAPKFGYIPGRRRRQTTLLETARIQGIFRSAAAKLEWANRHIAELERQSSDYLDQHWRFRLRTCPSLNDCRPSFHSLQLSAPPVRGARPR